MVSNLLKKIWESVVSVLPITVLVIIMALTMADIDGGSLGLFIVSAVLLIIGMGLFTLGADMAMMPMGNSVGARLSKSKNLWFICVVCLILGFLITIAEPDLQVLAEQLQSGQGKNTMLLYSVAVGVGIFFVVSVLRTFLKIPLRYVLLGAYALVFILAAVVNKVNPQFLALAFDSGGVTTGPITVPFLMALGIGLASVRGGKSSSDDSFGTIALCSVGPIIAVLILGLTGSKPEISNMSTMAINSAGDVFIAVGKALPIYLKEIALALLPILAVFFLFQIFTLKLPKDQIIKILIGVLYTYFGLVIFLTAVNVGFLPMGRDLGQQIGASKYAWSLIPLGMLMGVFIILAEPAVHVLNKQVEEVTGGSISKRTMQIALCLGVSVSIGLAFIRVLTGISIWYFIVPAYVLALGLSFFVPQIFTGIAFDSGGVASGPMTATFLLPMAVGATQMLNNNSTTAVFMDAYGLVAFVAMAPLVTVQLVGLIYNVKLKVANKRSKDIVAEAEGALALGNAPAVFGGLAMQELSNGFDEDYIEFEEFDLPTILNQELAPSYSSKDTVSAYVMDAEAPEAAEKGEAADALGADTLAGDAENAENSDKSDAAADEKAAEAETEKEEDNLKAEDAQAEAPQKPEDMEEPEIDSEGVENE